MEDSKPKDILIIGGYPTDRYAIGRGLAKLEARIMVVDDDTKIRGLDFDKIFFDEVVSERAKVDLLMSYQGYPEEVEKKSSISKTRNRGKGKHKNCWDSPYGK